MAFTVENGTGINGATSYATVQQFRDHHADRGNDVTAILDADVQELLIKATAHIDNRWGPQLKGVRRWRRLTSRSVLTLTAAVADGETVTVGSVVFTFRTTPSLPNDVEIGTSALSTLAFLINSGITNADVCGFEFADPDVASLTIYTTEDGIATTTTIANGSFDNAASSGASARRQRLEFPRVGVRDSAGNSLDGIQPEIIEATAEYALIANSATLDPNPSASASGVLVKRQKVGPIETEFQSESGFSTRRSYPVADRLLSEFITAKGITRL